MVLAIVAKSIVVFGGDGGTDWGSRWESSGKRKRIRLLKNVAPVQPLHGHSQRIRLQDKLLADNSVGC